LLPIFKTFSFSFFKTTPFTEITVSGRFKLDHNVVFNESLHVVGLHHVSITMLVCRIVRKNEILYHHKSSPSTNCISCNENLRLVGVA
jgi:hypothetical protein